MKRVITGSLLFAASVIVAIYIFIPSTLTISKTERIATQAEPLLRVITEKENWNNWGTDSTSNLANIDGTTSMFVLNSDTFRIIEVLQNAVQVNIKNGATSATGTISILPLSPDSSALQWQVMMESGSTPLTKFKRYKQAISIKKNMTSILQHIKAFAEEPRNLYGFEFSIGSTVDTLLVATKTVHSLYPDTDAMYQSVTRLQQYATIKGARQTSFPIANINKVSANEFQLMVAIPVDKQLPDNSTFFYRKMVPGKFLIAEVNGGPATVEHAIKMMELYMAENRKSSIAIPFQTLVTDRRKEADTTKWITKIFYPTL